MTATNQNLKIWDDRTSLIIVPIYQVDGVTPYTATTPVSAKWGMATNAQMHNPVLEKTTAGGGVTLTQDSGSGLWTATVTLNPGDTQGISPQKYYHELSVTDNVGDIVNVAIGTLDLQPSLVQY